MIFHLSTFGQTRIVPSKQDIIDLKDRKEANRSVGSINPAANPDVEFLIREVFIGGDCFDIENVVFSGGAAGLGTYSNGTDNIGIEDGFMMATGAVGNARGPNVVSNVTGLLTGPGSDSDLASLINSNDLHDVMVIEFDFKPTSDEVRFDYVFASDEYCEFVNSNFNDVFGFFLSGPGIAGPYSNGAINLATLPDGLTEVAINSVNSQTNDAFYVDNVPAGQNQQGEGDINQCAIDLVNDDPFNADIEYDGFTAILTAVADVIPCETYHIKLAITDVGDGIYDSAVFFKAQSFFGGSEAELKTEVVETTQNLVYEDCYDGSIVITRLGNSDINQDLIIDLVLSALSTATSGLDFVPLPNSVTIPAGQTQVRIPIIALTDDIIEGIETIIVELNFLCSCDNPFAEILIDDALVLDLELGDYNSCANERFDIVASPIGGLPEYDYIWNDGSMQKVRAFQPMDSISYILTVTDVCGHEAIDTLNFNIIPEPTATIDGDIFLCEGVVDTSIQVHFTGEPPFQFFYELNGEAQNIVSNITTFDYSLSIQDTGRYTIGAVSGLLNCFGDGSGIVDVAFFPFESSAVITEPECGQSDGAIDLILADTSATYQFKWSNGPITEDIQDIASGPYSVTVSDQNGCDYVRQFNLPSSSELAIEINPLSFPICGQALGAIDFNVSQNNGPFEVVWTPSLDSPAILSGLNAGLYIGQVIDSSGCIALDSVILLDTGQINIDNVITAPIACETPGTAEIVLDSAMSAVDIIWSTGQLNDSLINFNSPGNYAVVINYFACTDTFDFEISSTILDPNLSIEPSTGLNCSQNEQWIQAIFNDTIPVFNWTTINGNIVSNSDSTAILINQSAWYFIELIDTMSNCVYVDSVFISQNISTPNLTFDVPTLINCENTSNQINLFSDIPGVDYLIEPLDGIQFTLINDSLVEVTSNGGLIVTLINNVNGCFSIDTIFFNSNFNQPEGNAGTDLMLNCSQDSLQLNGQLFSPTNNPIIQWINVNGNYISNPTVLNPFINATGIYQLIITDPISKCKDTSFVEVTADITLPNADAGSSIELNCNNIEANLLGTNSDQGPNFNFLWTTTDGNIISGETTLIPLIDMPGTYTLLVTNIISACTAVSSVIVSADFTPPNTVPVSPEFLDCINGQANLLVNTDIINGTFIWQTTNGFFVSGANTNNAIVNQPGIYILQSTNTDNGCSNFDTVEVFQELTSPILTPWEDQILPCDPEIVRIGVDIMPPNPEFDIQWFDEQNNMIGTEFFVDVNQTGTFKVVVKSLDSGCESDAEIKVTAAEDIDATWESKDINCIIKFGQFKLQTTSSLNPPFEYSIDGGDFVPFDITTNNLSAGEHHYILRDALGCIFEETFTIDQAIQLAISLEEEVQLTVGDRFYIQVQSNKPENEINYSQWFPPEGLDCPTCIHTWANPLMPTEYLLAVEDLDGCVDTATIRILLETNPKVYIPNSFSPNNDNINDYFTVYTNEVIKQISFLYVFDRWGNKVFEAREIPVNEPAFGWDGTYKGEAMDPAVFVYSIEVELVNGLKKSFKGDINLVR